MKVVVLLGSSPLPFPSFPFHSSLFLSLPLLSSPPPPSSLTFHALKLTGSTMVGWMISVPGKAPHVTAVDRCLWQLLKSAEPCGRKTWKKVFEYPEWLITCLSTCHLFNYSDDDCGKVVANGLVCVVVFVLNTLLNTVLC